MSGKIHIKLKKAQFPSAKKCLLFMIVAGLLLPQGIYAMFPSLNTIRKVWSIAACIISIGWWGLKRKMTANRFTLLFAAFFLYIILNSIFHEISVYYALETYAQIIAIIFLADCFNDNITYLLDVISIYLLILAIINLICMLIYPNGMYISAAITAYKDNWLLGYKSSFVFYFYPLYILSLLNLAYERKIVQSKVSVVLCIAEFLIGGCMAPLVTSIVILILFVFTKRKWPIALSPKLCVIGILVLNVLLISGSLLKFGAVQIFITSVLKKSITLSGRDVIWATVLNAVRKHPMFGYGVTSPATRIAMYSMFQHAHNNLLEILYEGGTCWLAFFLSILFILCERLKMALQYKSTRVLCIAMFGLLIMSLTEPLTHQSDVLHWMLLYLCSEGAQINSELGIKIGAVIT